jgi:thiamine biosynthesis lipoprotein
MERLEFRAMGSRMLALQERRPAAGPDRLAEVPRWFGDWEQCLSRFRDTSELSQLNRAHGKWTPVSSVLWEVVDAAFLAAFQSDGLVSPALLDALEATGYDRSFDLLGAATARPSESAALPAVRMISRPRVAPWWTIERDAKAQALCLPPGMRLDLGGVAKGWAADRAARMLSRSGPALVDAGGDIAMSGPLAGGAPWTVGVADPNAPDADLETLLIRRGGVATSGRDYRRWQHAGRWQHHILDPRTGQPAITDVLSATVVAPSARAAEVGAKVALILGSRDGLAWIEARTELAALLVLEDGQIVRSRRLGDYVIV